MADLVSCKAKIDDSIAMAQAVKEGRAEWHQLEYVLEDFKSDCFGKPDKDFWPDPPKTFMPTPPPTAGQIFGDLAEQAGLPPPPPDILGDIGKMAAETTKEVVDSIEGRVHALKEEAEDAVIDLAKSAGIKL